MEIEMNPLYATAGLTLAAMIATPTSASVIFEFEPTKLSYFTEASGTIVISDEAYRAGKIRRWVGNWLHNPCEGQPYCETEIMHNDLVSLSISLYSETGYDGHVWYEPYMHDDFYMNGALMFDLEITEGPDGDTIDGFIYYGFGGYTEQSTGMLSDFGYGADHIEACWGAEISGSTICGAAGVWRRVSDPDTPAPAPEPATAALILAGLVGAARLRPARRHS